MDNKIYIVSMSRNSLSSKQAIIREITPPLHFCEEDKAVFGIP